MAKKTFEDLAHAEINIIQKMIDENLRQAHEAVIEIERLREVVNTLDERHDSLIKDLDKAKRQSSKLKKFIWTSDDPNITELRNEILLAAKLVQDN